MKIIQFQSPRPQTPFAPNWNYIMGETQLEVDNSINFFNKIKEIILSKESVIKSTYQTAYDKYNQEFDIVFDGDTGLGPNSLTSRSPFFNVMSWSEPEITTLTQLIYNEYVNFLSLLTVARQTVWIQCWANVMRAGEEIKEHIHASHELTWLGGHVTIACDNTSTFYANPMNLATGRQIHESKNVVGKLTLFQNNLPHYTNKHLGSQERISIAFDIITEDRYNQYPAEKRQHFIKFDTV